MIRKIIVVALTLLLFTGCAQNKTADAVYQIDGKPVTAEAYYAMLSEVYGTAYMYQILENKALEGVEISKETQATIQKKYDDTKSKITDEETRKYMDAMMKSNGYNGLDDLMLYLQNQYRKQSIIDKYVDENFKDESFLETQKPRKVMHVLVLSEKDGTLSAAAQQKTQDIDKALANTSANDFKDAVSKYVDGDTVIFEDLGYVDKDTNFEKPFLDAALAATKGEITGWVKTNYGYHRLVVYADSFEAFKGDAGYHEAVSKYAPKIENQAMWAFFNERNITFSDSFKAALIKYLEVEAS